METFEEWLETVPSLALRELAGGEVELRGVPKEQVYALLRATPALLGRARESYKIEVAAAKAVAAIDPWIVRDKKIRYGLVD